MEVRKYSAPTSVSSIFIQYLLKENDNGDKVTIIEISKKWPNEWNTTAKRFKSELWSNYDLEPYKEWK